MGVGIATLNMLLYTDNRKAYIAVATVGAIVASVDIANGTQALAGQPDFPRTIDITVTNTHSDITAGIVTVSGTAINGRTVSESLDLSAALTLAGTVIFATVTSVVVTGLSGATAGDTLTVDTGATVQLTEGRTTFVNAIVGSGASQVGKYQFIDNITGTTTNAAELKQAIAAGVYEFNISMALGLRVVMSGATPLTVTYNQ
jgi:hypothetical protein